MTQQHRFLTALKRLQDWHADAVKARDYNTPAVDSGKPGAAVLRRQNYPGTTKAWAAWRHAKTPIEREAVIRGLEHDFQGLSQRPIVESFRDYWGKTRYRIVKSPEIAG